MVGNPFTLLRNDMYKLFVKWKYNKDTSWGLYLEDTLENCMKSWYEVEHGSTCIYGLRIEKEL